MGTDYDTVLARVRKRIREPSAIDFTDADLFRFISEEERRLFDELGSLPGAGRAVRSDEITIAANATTFSLVTGSPPTALTSEFVAVSHVEWDDNGVWIPLNEIHEGDEWRFDTVDDAATSSNVRPGYLIRETVLNVKPKTDVARSLRLAYFYRPAEKDNVSPDTDALDTPTRWDELIVCRVASKCFEHLGTADDRLELRIQQIVGEMEVVEVNKQPRERVETVRRTTTMHWRR